MFVIIKEMMTLNIMMLMIQMMTMTMMLTMMTKNNNGSLCWNDPGNSYASNLFRSFLSLFVCWDGSFRIWKAVCEVVNKRCSVRLRKKC